MTWPEATIATAGSGNEALSAFSEQHPDLVILDVNMPPPDGYMVCEQIRNMSDVPILMLSVRDSINDKMRGFDLGADDYLTKPFDHMELIARIRALVRRANNQMLNDVPEPECVSIDEPTRTAVVGGRRIMLTSKEFRLLSFLIGQAGTVLSHQQILENVWGEGYRHEIHYLKVFVRRLRRKLGDDAAQPRYIQTEWGVGYRFVGPLEREQELG